MANTMANLKLYTKIKTS